MGMDNILEHYFERDFIKESKDNKGIKFSFKKNGHKNKFEIRSRISDSVQLVGYIFYLFSKWMQLVVKVRPICFYKICIESNFKIRAFLNIRSPIFKYYVQFFFAFLKLCFCVSYLTKDSSSVKLLRVTPVIKMVASFIKDNAKNCTVRFVY